MPTDSPICVTGGAGAIGSVVVKALVDAGKSVVVIDNLSSGFLDNIQGLACEFVNADIRDADKLKAVFRRDFAIVIHLAAHFANQNSVDFPVTDLSVNIAGTVNLLEQCKDRPIKFVYASSSCVYGSSIPPFKEDSSLIDLHTPYAISKYAGELYTAHYAQNHGMDTVILRFFNSFGPCDPPGQYRNVVPNFIMRAMNGQDLIITGTGDETRDFNYCDNTTQGIIASCAAANKGQAPVYNLGYGKETSIREMAEAIIRLTNSKSRIVYKERRSWDHIVRRAADVSKAEREIGYRPAVDVHEGLKRTVEWFAKVGHRRFSSMPGQS